MLVLNISLEELTEEPAIVNTSSELLILRKQLFFQKKWSEPGMIFGISSEVII